MGPSTAAPQQLKQPSRKGKRAWRKNVDLTEIDSGLSSLRDELIQGGVLAEKPSDQLFAVDTAGDAALPKTLAHRARTSIKPLKADQILGQRSAIPAVDARKRSGLGVTDGVLEPRSKRHRAPYVSATEYARLRRVGRGSASATQPPVGGEDGAPTHDPWAVAPEAAAGDEPHAFLTPPRAVREPATLRTSPVSLLAGAKAAPAVARPRPGTSYNPSFGDWDALLAAAGAREVAAEVQRRAEARRREELEAKIVAAQEEEEEAARAGEGGESVWEGIESEFEDAGAAGGEAGRVKKVKIKTRAERNKIRRRKEAEREEKLKLKGRKLEEQVGSVKKMVKELRRQESQKKSGKALATESDGSESEEVDDERLRRHLKKSLLPPKSLELVLPDELQDSLRRLRPEGNLLRERFRNAVVRGHVEPRKPIVQPRKPKRYMVEKWSYRDFPVVV